MEGNTMTNHNGANDTGTFTVKKGLAQMLKGGVIMDVVTPEHARIAEEAGAGSVMALERAPSDIRAAGGVARMSDPDMIRGIMDAVTIPVMAKARIGHFVEAQILEALGVDFVEAVRHMAQVKADIKHIQNIAERDLGAEAERMRVPVELVQEVRELGRLPVVTFVAGGIATPADAALMMQMGADGVFVGSGIFKSSDPAAMAAAIVKATTHFADPQIVAEVSFGLGDAMAGTEIAALGEQGLLQTRGW